MDSPLKSIGGLSMIEKTKGFFVIFFTANGLTEESNVTAARIPLFFIN